MENHIGFRVALEEARQGFAEGGIPIGAALVSKEGKVLGRGRNRRVQKGSAILHAEMDCFENAGRLPATAYKGAICFSTLQPCDIVRMTRLTRSAMSSVLERCTGACILYGVAKVVIGENENFSGQGLEYLQQRGIEVINLDDKECKDLMKVFIEKYPDLW